MRIRIRNLISTETQSWLLWCLAVQAQGPVGAMGFMPVVGEDHSPRVRGPRATTPPHHATRTRRSTAYTAKIRAGGAVVAVLAVCLVLTSTALAAEDFTWSGGESSSDWSEGTNWLGGSAPTAGASIGTLTFDKAIAAINFSENNVPDLTVEHWQINDTHEYLISGEPLTLGSGGLSIMAEAGGAPYTSFMPLTLAASQSWSITGGAGDAEGQHVIFGGTLSGEAANLTINFAGAGTLPWLSIGSVFGPVVDDELGNVTIEGTGAPSVELGADLNTGDGHSVTLKGVHFYAAGGATGPLISEGATVSVAPLSLEQFGPSRLSVASASFDSTSHVAFAITDAGTEPGHDYSQLTSSGSVALGSATLELYGACPTVSVGQVYTVISTTGSLTGTFGNAPNGGTIVTACVSAERWYSYRVNYNTVSSPETVTLTALPAVPTLGEQPTIAGTATEGQTLTATHGYWTNSPTNYSDQWQRCNSEGDNCQDIAGATTQSYTLATADVGSTIRVQEIASNSEGSSIPALSAPTAVVQASSGGSSGDSTTSTSTSGTGTESAPIARTATMPSESMPAPILGQRQTVNVTAGTVTVRLKSTTKFVPLSAASTIPDGSEVEATNGHVLITVATPNGHTQSAEVWGGRFVIDQERTGSGETRFILSLPLTGCPRVTLPRGSAAALAASAKHRSGPKSRHLWVSEGGGSWGTNGRYVSTSVEGTRWLTLDECSRSEVEVAAGKVKVHDLVRNKTKTITTGQHYTATAKRHG